MHTPETRKRAYEKIKRCRQDWFAANGPCASCGLWDRLEVDHIDSTKKVDHRVWSWSVARRNEELAKCQPLCYNCHKKKHSGPEHGVSGYARGCRCKECTDAKWAANAKWRLERFGSLSSHNRVNV